MSFFLVQYEKRTMSCLFDSLAFYLPDSALEVRSRICDYLCGDGPIIDGVKTSEILSVEAGSHGLGRYVEKMRGAGTWGGGVEIQAACVIWKLKVVVDDTRGRGIIPIVFDPVFGNSTREIHLSWDGSHYTPSPRESSLGQTCRHREPTPVTGT